MPSRAQGRRCLQLRYPGHQGSGLDSAGELVLISSVSCDSYLCSYISFSSLYFQVFALGLLFSFFQSIGIGYKRAHPACQISVQGFAPRPCLQIKTSGSSQAFRRYGFVDAVQECCARHMQDGYVKRVERATIGDVNDALDKLATLKTNNEKVPVVRGLMDKMDARQMRWLSAIIIKDMKLGYGEAAILRHFHRDAEDLYNVCCDLRRVCETLHTKAVAFKRQDLQPGSLVRSMNAAKKRDCDEARYAEGTGDGRPHPSTLGTTP